MSRLANTTGLSPLQIATGAMILQGTDAGVPGAVYPPHFEPDVVEMLNYAFSRRGEVYVAGPTGPTNWAGNGEARALGAVFDAALTTWVVRFRMRAKIDPDSPSLSVGAVCQFAAAETGSVRFTIGSAAPVVLNFTNGNSNVFITGTVATSSTGTGWQWIIVELERTAGASLTNQLDYIYVADTLAIAIPAPQNA